MAVSPFDSALYRDLYCDAEVDTLLGDEAELRSMLQVEAAFSRVQGRLGIIPAESAEVIDRVASSCDLDPSSLAATTAKDGIPVPALVAALREAVGDAEHAQYVHWGATTQDIMDTALVLRLRELISVYRKRIASLLQVFAGLAEQHAELPMVAHTRRQAAIPTSFGAQVAAWGTPLLTHLEVLAQTEPRLLRVSLSGAAGNSAVLGDDAQAIRQALAEELGLGADEISWHSDRSVLAEFSGWLTRVAGSLAKFAEDVILASQSEIGELTIDGGGSSSTMPNKQNPVSAESIQTLFRISVAMDGLMHEALLHRQQRDGSAWALEWHALPQLCMACASSLKHALALATGLQPSGERMLANLEEGGGLIYAEAFSFELARKLPRPEAQARIKNLCRQVAAGQGTLVELATQSFPEIDWATLAKPEAQLGDAPEQARSFAKRVAALME